MLRLAAIACAFVVLAADAHAASSPYANWAAVVVAGDREDSDGNPSKGFDNARREIGRDLLKLGFSPDNIAEFSMRPRAYRKERLFVTRPNTIMRKLDEIVRRTSGGCLLYFSSHGESDGLIVGNWVMPPRALAQLVDGTCGSRPTVVIVSACFSGIMLPPLKAANRMILTAARRDRTSFGCGQSDRYPYFDQCVLESWPKSRSFPDLADHARTCVAARERHERIRPASEPQYWIGSQALASLPNWH